MKKFNLYFLLLLWCLISISVIYSSDKYSDVKVRQPAVAGKFYPADKTKLIKAIQYYLEDAVKVDVNKPAAIIAPHAGYIFSGQIAADAYNQLRIYNYDIIVILGTNHTTYGFNKVSIYPREGYSTPLGIAELDTKLADKLIESDDRITYRPDVHTREHSVEVQIPFVQHIFPEAKILPLVIGSAYLNLCIDFGKILAKNLKDSNALVVASSDLSHYPNFDDAVKVDKNILEAIIKLDPSKVKSVINDQMNNSIDNLSTCACGEGPILTAMAYANEVGAKCGTIISYANSGQASIGDRQRVVGYGAVTFSKEKNCPERDVFNDISSNTKSFNFNTDQKKILLSFARKSINQFLYCETIPLAREFSTALNCKQGAFVTLKRDGELRGCIGHMAEDLPLLQVVGSMAIQAAFNDSRFNPVTVDEFPQIEIEISVLTPSEQISSIDEIILGRDGVILSKNGKHAVFLPQVATETGWSKIEFLDRLCYKAGLEAGDWKDADLFTFQAKVFKESDFN